jgi:mRNA interferase MazF
MARARYIPGRGELVWIDLEPRRGREQAGHRPALVLTPREYNRRTGLCVVCPATSKAKGYYFEVACPEADDPDTVILVDQLRCLDWHDRRPRLIRPVSDDTLDEVVAKLDALLINPDV